MAKKTASKEKEKAPAAPVKLGEKRTCLKCSTKFYDFAKNPIVCPKCNAKMTPEDFASRIPPAEPKKVKEKATPTESMLQSDDSDNEPSDDTFESVEDLADEEDVTDDIDMDKDESEY